MGKSSLFGFVHGVGDGKRHKWRKKLFLNIGVVIYVGFVWFSFGGEGFGCFLEKEVGYNEVVIYMLKI